MWDRDAILHQRHTNKASIPPPPRRICRFIDELLNSTVGLGGTRCGGRGGVLILVDERPSFYPDSDALQAGTRQHKRSDKLGNICRHGNYHDHSHPFRTCLVREGRVRRAGGRTDRERRKPIFQPMPKETGGVVEPGTSKYTSKRIAYYAPGARVCVLFLACRIFRRLCCMRMPSTRASHKPQRGPPQTRGEQFKKKYLLDELFDADVR